MRKFFRGGCQLLCLLTLAGVSSCGSGDDNPLAPEDPPSGQNIEFTVMSGWWNNSAGEGRSSEIPTEVTAVDLYVTSENGNHSQSITLVPEDETADFQISLPAGRMVRFEMVASGESDIPLFRGVLYHMIPTVADSFHLTMSPVTDTTAPTLIDNLTVTPRSSYDLDLAWSPATTGGESDLRVGYLIWATPSGQAPTTLPNFVTYAGQINLLASGLQAETIYDLLVVATDHAGNLSAGTAGQTASTFSLEVGLFVDVDNGQDSPDRGSLEAPFKTITYALTQTEGFEPIYIRPGYYSVRTGEIFPLVLKNGTQLRGDFQPNYAYPNTTIEVGPGSAGIVCNGWNAISFMRLMNKDEETFVAEFIDARNGDIIMDYVVIDCCNSSSINGVFAMKMALIRNSIFMNFSVQGQGVGISCERLSYVLGCTFSNCIFGVGTGSPCIISGCEVFNCNFGILMSGEDIRVCNNLISGGYDAISIQNASNSLVCGNLIHDVAQMGIETFNCEASLRIEDCEVYRAGTAVYIRNGSATLLHNTFTCNGTNLFVGGTELVDARRNAWSRNPPLVRDNDESFNDDEVDILYTGDYAGTPRPMWDPCLVRGNCMTFAVTPWTKND